MTSRCSPRARETVVASAREGAESYQTVSPWPRLGEARQLEHEVSRPAFCLAGAARTPVASTAATTIPPARLNAARMSRCLPRVGKVSAP
jgi:hypothetical protein